MSLKFLEYIDVDGERINLYIIQEALAGDARCFKIDVRGSNKFQFYLCKEQGGTWKVITQDFPEFIIANLFEPLITSIERRLVLERDFLTLN